MANRSTARPARTCVYGTNALQWIPDLAPRTSEKWQNLESACDCGERERGGGGSAMLFDFALVHDDDNNDKHHGTC